MAESPHGRGSQMAATGTSPPAAEGSGTAKDQSRFLLPVPGLGLSRAWEVGTVRFHPAGAAAGLIDQARQDTPTGPDWYTALLAEQANALDMSAVADVSAGAIGEAIPVVERALASLRVVQRLQHPMVDPRRQAFGLPGQVKSSRIEYLDLTVRAAPGWQHLGAATGWSFTDDDHDAWAEEPAYRFLDEALACPAAGRTSLQHRALVAVGLISQAWLTWQPDLALLNSVMALEMLLGEPGDSAKKFRLARRVCYFICGWPEPRYPGGREPACPYLALPINTKGRPGTDLSALITGGRQAAYERGLYCSQFFDVLDLYDDRSAVTHGGELGLSEREEIQATWFITAWLLLPVLRWMAGHPGADLDDLDTEIAAVRGAPDTL
jgi:hypothetical protein